MKHKDGESRNKPSSLWSIDFQQGCQDNSMEGKTSLFDKSGSETTGYSHKKQWSWAIYLTPYTKLTQNG